MFLIKQTIAGNFFIVREWVFSFAISRPNICADKWAGSLLTENWVKAQWIDKKKNPGNETS